MRINNIQLPETVGEEADWIGIEHPDPVLWLDKRDENGYGVVVLKMPGHNYWAGRGEQGYAPTHFAVCEVVEIRENGRSNLATSIEIPTRLNSGR